jgi:uncharacterized repeat protein (TIGR01451 family)
VLKNAPAALRPVIEDGPSTVSGPDGVFHLAGLERGTHKLYLDLDTLPVELRPDSATSPVILWLNPGQSLVSTATESGVRFSAAYHATGDAISGVVFLDQDGDGRQRAGEPGLSGVTVIDPTSHQYFIPFDDRNLIALLEASDQCQPSPSAPPEEVGAVLASNISLTASSNGTTYYYDHWEDGYDADPLNPAPSTEIGLLNAGQVRTFASNVDTTVPWGSVFYYDGGDRITIVGEEASVVRSAYPASAIGTRLAGAWEIEEVAAWGDDYIVPAGEDWGAGADFEFTGATITALQDGTQLYYNGSLAATLSAGGTHFINGVGDGSGLNSGDMFTATHPIQVHTYSSICASGMNNYWSGNGYTLEPVQQWDSDYWSPVQNRSVCPNGNSAAVDIFLYNASGGNINLTIDDGAVYNRVLPPGRSSVLALIAPASLSDVRGVHIYGDGPFWGVVNVDTERWVHEWGYSLIPQNDLSSMAVLGWAPGNGHNPPLTQYPPNGNLAWVTPITDTAIYADFNQDGNADDMDCNGDGDALDAGVCAGLDELGSSNGITVTQGSTLRIADPTDADLTGALIFTRDLSHRIAVAWGQDACVAQTGNPYLDLGYTVLPIAVPSVSKFDALAQDVDGSGDVSPGDILTYTIVIANDGFGPMNNVVMTDVLPYTYTDFIVGSIASTFPFINDDYFDGSDWLYTPAGGGPYNTDPNVQQLRLFWNQIAAQLTVSVTFRVQIGQVDPDVMEISNLAIVDADNTNPRDSEDPGDPDPDDPDTDTPLGQPILWLDKLPSDPTTVAPGGLLTYTIVVSNVGTATALSALVVDDLPPWLSYEPSTLDLTWPVAEVVTTTIPISVITGLITDTIGDDFDLPDRSGDTNFAGSDGTLPWLGDWSEINDTVGPDAGDVRVNTGVAVPEFASLPSFLNLNDALGNGDSGARRCADLGGFNAPQLSYNMRGAAVNPVIATYRVEITGTSTLTTVLFSETYASTAYTSRYVDLSPFANDPQVCVSFIAEASLTGFNEYYRIDNVFLSNNPPETYGTVDLIKETTVISYLSVSNTDPLTYTRILSDPFTTAITHTMDVTRPFAFPAQSNVTITFQMRVGYPLTDGLVLLNSASITATNVHTTPYPLRDDTPTTIQSSHALTITKADDPDPVLPGNLLTYTLFWEVGGDEPAPNVVVSDVLPLPYVSFNSCAPLPACQGETFPGSGVVVWNLGNRLPPMSGVTYDSGWLTVTVNVEQRPPGGVFTNTAFIGDDDPDTPGDQDDEPTEVPIASFALSKQRLTASPVPIGVLVRYQIAITNTGELTITQLPLQDTYDPVYLEFQSAVPAPDVTAPPGTLVWNDLTTYLPGLVLPPNASTQIVVDFLSISSTQQLLPPVTVNTAAVDGARTDAGTLPRQEDSAEVEIEDTAVNASFALSKQLISTPTVPIGSPVQFLIVITNTGDLTITQLPLQDTYDPFYLQYQSALPVPDVATPPGTLAWNDLTDGLPGLVLPPAQSTQVLVQFIALTTTQHLTPPVTVNTAVVDGARTDAGDLPRQGDSAEVGIEDEGPTAIELLYLRAGPKSGGVLVEWATLFEINTYGFWLYRGSDADPEHATPLVFVPAQGWLNLGAAYQVLDVGLPPGLTYYWLVEVENDGAETRYGPVSAWPGWNEADLPYRVYLPLLRRP